MTISTGGTFCVWPPALPRCRFCLASQERKGHHRPRRPALVSSRSGQGRDRSPAPHQAKSSNLLTVNEAHYLVDAGDGVARRLAEARIDLREAATILITIITTKREKTQTQES